MNYKYLIHKTKVKTPIKAFFSAVRAIRLSKKQKIALVLTTFAFGFMIFSPYIIAQSYSNSQKAPESFELKYTKDEINQHGRLITRIETDYNSAYGLVNVLRTGIYYIANSQIGAINAIRDAKMGGNGMFNFLVTGLTIFACIGCAYKIVKHYLDTERHDNVKAVLGYFSYIPILVLFMFSGTIVDKVVKLNQPLNTSNITKVGDVIMKQIDTEYQKNYDAYKTKAFAYLSEDGMIDGTVGELKYMGLQFSTLGSQFKFLWFSFLGIIITAVLAVPAFTLTLMVKILLSVAIYGCQLVFLLAFIPGFENTWKTYMLNILNILLWIPIFNALMGFIISIVSGMIGDNSVTNGQIIWLTIVSIICAFQAVSLTTTSAGIIINGTGAGMAGAMGSLSSMNAVSMAGNVMSGGAKLAAGVVGAKAVGNSIASKFKK